jgi:branched-chain amino acid transport system ATP-binding protein
MSILRTNNLCIAFGGLKAVDDVTFEVEPGIIKAIIGPNGAGKTTLFNLITGSLQPDSGNILFKDKPVHNFPPHRIACLRIGRTFQNIKLFPQMTVLENVMIGCHTLTQTGFLPAMLGLSSSHAEDKRSAEKAMLILQSLGLAAHASQTPSALPFGTQKNIEIARALVMDPELLLLDEPAAGLNMNETKETSEIIKKIRDRGITVVLIEHDMSLVMGISDEVMVLSSGRKIAEGSPHEVQRNQEVIRVYLGEEDA